MRASALPRARRDHGAERDQTLRVRAPRQCAASRLLPGQRSRAKRRPNILQLVPDSNGDGVSAHDQRRFHRRIVDAMELPTPLLIPEPDDAAPGMELVRYLPDPVQLTPMGREIMPHHLRLAYRESLIAVRQLVADLGRRNHHS